MPRSLLVTLVVLISAAAGYGLQHYVLAPEQAVAAAVKTDNKARRSIIGQSRPGFEYTDIEGELRNANEWNGKVLLVNFWATWCPPCKKEIPAFIELQEQYEKQGFQIVGIAIDDEDSVRDYADSMGMNYPIMAAETDAIELSRQYGNRISALPFSAFIDRQGKVVKVRAGGLSKQAAENIILPLL